MGKMAYAVVNPCRIRFWRFEPEVDRASTVRIFRKRSAQPTSENSPALLVLGLNQTDRLKSVKRTTEGLLETQFQSSVSRTAIFISLLLRFPALKCWATFKPSASRTPKTASLSKAVFPACTAQGLFRASGLKVPLTTVLV